MLIPQVSAPVLVLDAGENRVALLLALPAVEAQNWPRTLIAAFDDAAILDAARAFLASNGMEKPSLTLVCGMGRHNERGISIEGRAVRIARWREELRCTGGAVSQSLREDMSGWEVAPLLDAVKSAFGPALGADSGTAALFAALGLDTLRDRSWSEGVTVVHADETHTQAFTVFKEKLLGLYENHADLSRDALVDDLKELRLNWLPDEQVRAAGGHGCICGDFPAEAEGFRPTWIFGTRREVLSGAGRLATLCGDAAFDRCFGLLCGLAGKREAE